MAVMAIHPLANSQNLSDQEVARIVSSGRYFPAARDFSLREKADTMEMRIMYGFEYVIDTLSGKCLHEPYMLEIGGELTHYYSYNAYIRDSVQSEVYASERSKGMNAFTDITSSVIPEDQTATYYEIFRCIPSSSRYVLLRVQNTDYSYSEKAEQTEWRLSDRTDTVCGYRCQGGASRTGRTPSADTGARWQKDSSTAGSGRYPSQQTYHTLTVHGNLKDCPA